MYILDDAFEGCQAITNITIPATVEYIGETVFNQCGNLTNVMVLNHKLHFETGAFNHDDFRPNNLTIAGWKNSTAEAYAEENTGCTFVSLNNQTLFLPTALTEIDDDAFAGAASRFAVIPKNVTEIIGNPFTGSQIAYICGYPGTAAQSFATGNGYSFIPVDDEWMANCR